MQNLGANLFNDEFRKVPWHTVENDGNMDDAPKGGMLKGHHFLG